MTHHLLQSQSQRLRGSQEVPVILSFCHLGTPRCNSKHKDHRGLERARHSVILSFGSVLSLRGMTNDTMTRV